MIDELQVPEEPIRYGEETKHGARDHGKFRTSCILSQSQTSGFPVGGNQLPIRVENECLNGSG